VAYSLALKVDFIHLQNDLLVLTSSGHHLRPPLRFRLTCYFQLCIGYSLCALCLAKTRFLLEKRVVHVIVSR